MEKKGIPSTPVHEPDLDDELTALVLHPFQGAARWTSGLPLALREPRMAS